MTPAGGGKPFCPDCGKQRLHRKLGERLVPIGRDSVVTEREAGEAHRVLCPDCGAVHLVCKLPVSPDNNLRRGKVFFSVQGIAT